MHDLTLIGMREGAFHPLSFLDQNLSAENFKKKLEVKIDINQVKYFDTAKLIESYKNMPLGGAKDDHFSCFHSSCQLGLKQELRDFAPRSQLHNLFSNLQFWQCWQF